ncbi:uncharacterized protein LOC125187643 [Salvia hispanica]|uniref:uncharacterized protein LOC125187643 n=1 Tax=Salvia hispanica TaxID=49212 RepID=UPI0020090C4F|nr:uncharacterized protein LOC125187643 [Salvia hispanica]
MSDAKKDIKFSLKAMVNKKKGKVLFVEVDGTFADVLISFLTLPLGTIVKILKKHCGDTPPQFGSLTTLYTGLANLDDVHFCSEGAKSILVHPRSSNDAARKKLKLDVSDSPPLEYFNCPKKCTFSDRVKSISMYHDPYHCSYCYSSPMEREKAENETQTVTCDDDGVFMKAASSFLITDDLHIMPNAGLLQVASFIGNADMDEAEMMDVTFESYQVMELLMFSLISMNPLSVIILNRKPEYKKGTEFTADASDSTSKTMNLKLIVQKSMNKLLYAEAEQDFIDFLFSFLIIPLGGVESLLSRNSHVEAIDNLYKSTSDLIHDKYFKYPEVRNRLMKPCIPHGYISENHIFPLAEVKPIYPGQGNWRPSAKFPRGQGNYLIGPRTYKITDDLTVTPFSVVCMLSSLNEKKIPVSDVEEVELQIGLNEGLSILKASLTSKCALTDALLTQILNRKRKRQEV